MERSGKRFAFVQLGDFSHVNEMLRGELAAAFPEFQCDIIELSPCWRGRREILLRLPQALWEYGGKALANGPTLEKCALTTTGMFRRFSRFALEALKGKQYQFIFQTDCMYDASLPGIPHFIYQDHTALLNTMYPLYDELPLSSEKWVRLEKATYQQADRVFVMTSAIRNSLIGQYGVDPDKAVDVGAGYNYSGSTPPRPLESYGNREIIFVGLDWTRKGGPELLEAFRKVRSVLPDAKLRIIGCSPKIDDPNCIISGKVPLQELTQYYNRASVFCMPSRREPCGLVYFDAMHHRLPIVGTPVGCVPDVTCHGVGDMVRFGDVDGLATVLTRWLRNPAECQAKGNLGHDLVQKHYNWPHVAKLMSNEIRATLAEETPEPLARSSSLSPTNATHPLGH